MITIGLPAFSCRVLIIYEGRNTKLYFFCGPDISKHQHFLSGDSFKHFFYFRWGRGGGGVESKSKISGSPALPEQLTFISNLNILSLMIMKLKFIKKDNSFSTLGDPH